VVDPSRSEPKKYVIAASWDPKKLEERPVWTLTSESRGPFFEGSEAAANTPYPAWFRAIG